MHLPCSSLAILAFIASTVLPPAAAFPSYAVHPLKDSPASVTVGHSYHTHNGTTNRTVDHNYYAHNGTALKKRDHTIVTCHGSDMCQASRTDITKDSTNFLIFNDLVEKLKSGIEPARKYSNM